MPTYTNLSLGSTGEDVKKLQSALGVNPDGVFGEKTEAAVKKYQQENGIGVDGVAGNTTLNKLYGTGGSGVPYAVTQGMQQPAAPTYNPQYDAQINALFDKLMNRESFSYDAASDPLFQQYRDIYTQQGKMAMQDTMGQAAALTGGYGSSYGQAVGQQQYDAYLQKLNGMIPEFYGQAYEQYAAEGNDLKNQYSMLMNKDAQDYARYQDALSQYYGRQDANYQRLVSLITTTGYQPSAQELAEAGLTAEQAAAYRSYYTQQQAAANGSTGIRYYPKTDSKDYKVNADGTTSVIPIRSLSFDPDEGIFTWNGKHYNKVDGLVAAWNNTAMSDDDEAALRRKFKSQTGVDLSDYGY